MRNVPIERGERTPASVASGPSSFRSVALLALLVSFAVFAALDLSQVRESLVGSPGSPILRGTWALYTGVLVGIAVWLAARARPSAEWSGALLAGVVLMFGAITAFGWVRMPGAVPLAAPVAGVFLCSTGAAASRSTALHLAWVGAAVAFASAAGWVAWALVFAL